MQLQKPSLSNERFKEPATMYRYKYKKYPEEVIHCDKQCQETEQSVCKGQKCASMQCSDRQSVKPVMKNKDMWSRKPATETKSSLCRDRYCQSTRCFKKATRCLNTKSLEKPRCKDDKNCQLPQFMWPVKKLIPRCHKYHQSTSTEKKQNS